MGFLYVEYKGQKQKQILRVSLNIFYKTAFRPRRVTRAHVKSRLMELLQGSPLITVQGLAVVCKTQQTVRENEISLLGSEPPLVPLVSVTSEADYPTSTMSSEAYLRTNIVL